MLMNKAILPGCILFWAMAGLAIAQSQGQLLTGFGQEPITASYQQMNALFPGMT